MPFFFFYHFKRRNWAFIKSSRSESKEQSRWRGVPAFKNGIMQLCTICLCEICQLYVIREEWRQNLVKPEKSCLNQWKSPCLNGKTHSRSWTNIDWSQIINLSWFFVFLIQLIFFQPTSKSLETYNISY